MSKDFFHIAVGVSVVISLWGASAFAGHYVVRNNDTLSQIAEKSIAGPVWGKTGSLNRVLTLNSQRVKKPDYIYPGQVIEVPGREEVAENQTQPKVERTPASENESSDPLLPATPAATSALAEQSVQPGPLGPPPLGTDAFGIFSVEAAFFSTRFQATETANGSHATLLSQSSSIETFSYTQHWDDGFKTSIYFGLGDLSINIPATGGTVDNSSPTLHRFGVTGAWMLNPKMDLGFGLGMNQEPFLTGVAASAISLDLLYVPSFQVFSTIDLCQRGPFTLVFQGLLGITAPASTAAYHANWNPDYGGSLFVRQRAFSWVTFETGGRFTYETENTSIASQSQTDMGVFLKLSFPLGEN